MENLQICIRPDFLGFQGLFYHKGQEYLASQCFRKDGNYTECVIFKTTNGQITFKDALGEYRKIDVELTRESLIDCIEEFVASLS